MELFFGMFFAHMVADWMLQTEYQAMGKMKGAFFNGASVSHGMTHALCYAVALAWNDVSLGWTLLVFISHVFIDRRWPVEWWIVHVQRTKPETVKALWWLVIAVDQALHISIIGLIVLSVRSL